MDSEYRVSLLFIFSMVEIFSNFMFFVMGTRYLHRISSLFHRSQQKIRPAFEK